MAPETEAALAKGERRVSFGDKTIEIMKIVRERGTQRVVKSKSMLTEECGLNPFLEVRGIEVVDTDLGERIVQLAKEPPSHIVAPVR